MKIPTKMEVVSTFYCGLCRTKPLFLSASIPMSGFVAGQNVVVSVDIVNESRIDVEDVKISLKKIILYHSQTPSKKTKAETLSETEVRCGGVEKRNKAKYDQKIVIPPVPPSNMNYCQVINVEYEIHVTAKIAGIHRNPVVKLPITIGTVPLNVSLPQNQQFAIHYPSTPSHAPSPTGCATINDAITRQLNTQNTNGDIRKSVFCTSRRQF